MTRPLDPVLLQTVIALIDGLEHARVRYSLIGALVPELLLKTPPPRRTNDADAVVQVETLDDFERVKSVLELKQYGFTRTRGPFRLERGAGRVDVLPYSETLAPGGFLRIPPSTPYSMLGFDKVHHAQTRVTIDGGRTVPLVTLPLYALLKIVAYSDRREPRDPAGVLHCLLYYEEDSDRLYGVEHEGVLIDFDVAGAHLLGLDGREFVDSPLAAAIGPILAGLSDPESPVGFQTVREYRGGTYSDRRRRAPASRGAMPQDVDPSGDIPPGVTPASSSPAPGRATAVRRPPCRARVRPAGVDAPGQAVGPVRSPLDAVEWPTLQRGHTMAAVVLTSIQPGRAAWAQTFQWPASYRRSTQPGACASITRPQYIRGRRCRRRWGSGSRRTPNAASDLAVTGEPFDREMTIVGCQRPHRPKGVRGGAGEG